MLKRYARVRPGSPAPATVLTLLAGLGPLRIAVNLSARQFAEPNLVPGIARVLDVAV